MDTSIMKKPKTMAELLPGLSGILSKDAMQTLTAKKQPRQTIANTRTAEKVLKPLTIAEMKADILALRVQSPRRFAQGSTSVKKKWNCSVKVENKTVSHTANGQMKHNSVRKVLNFQPPKPKPPKMSVLPNSKSNLQTETPRFPKPELKVKKSLHLQARQNVRISGICNIPETPTVVAKPLKSRVTLANKENISNLPPRSQKLVVINKKLPTTPKSCLRKKIPLIPDTPLTNDSWRSSCDNSFLQKEKEIEICEAKTNAEESLGNITEVSQTVSTPFKEYRNINDFFNSSDVMDSSYNDNTIMTFDQPNIKREESVIVSLCDMLNKATVSNTRQSTELDDLLEVEKQTENNIKMIENGIKTLNNIKESQIKSLEYVKKLIQDKKNNCNSESDKDKTVIETTKDIPKHDTTLNNNLIPYKPCSVIKKSPSYKIPKKNTCLRKKVFCKSMPNVSGMITPQKDMGDKALSMYMKMKEHMDFLNTPVVKSREETVPDTPSMTSHNLQMQLDKLYTAS